MRIRHGTRRLGGTARLLTAAAAFALVIGACGSGNGDDDQNGGTTDDNGAAADDNGAGDEPEEIELTFAWWGGDERHEQTQQIIEVFEDEYPHISIRPDFTDWGGYWDKLAVQVSGGDAPDIITQEERFMTRYALDGQLLDLNEVASVLDLADIDELALGGGEIEGGLYGVATGVNAFAIVADPQIFDEAGVDLPDDSTWTWQDYIDISVEISESTPDGVYGAQNFGSNEAGFNTYARQRGEALYDQEGNLAFSASTLADWWRLSIEQIEAGGTPPADWEPPGEGPDQSLIALNEGAMGFWWTNQLGGLTEASGRDLVLLRQPGESEADQPGMYLKPAMHYSISSQTEHPGEAAMFVDFLLNDFRAAEIMRTDRGLPANLEVREQLLPMLPETEMVVAEFMAEITPDLLDPPPAPPDGAGETVDIITRIFEGVLFGQSSPDDAAEQFVQEVETATS